MPDHSAMLRQFSHAEITQLKAVWDTTEGATPTKHLRLMDKYAKALDVAGKPPFLKSDTAYADVRKVILLRVYLVHFKTEWHESSVQQNNSSMIHRKVGTAFAENTQPIGGPWFPNKCLGAGCARWACDGVTTFAGQWQDRLGIPHTYESGVASHPMP